jgi:hypothetical protein
MSAAPPPSPPLNRLAVVAFATSLALGPVAFWLTIPLAAVARTRIRRSAQGGAGLARAAIAISCIYLALTIVVAALAFVVRAT